MSIPTSMSMNTQAHALRLYLTPQLGNYTIVKLLRHFNDLDAIFNASRAELSSLLITQQINALERSVEALEAYWPTHCAYLAESPLNQFITWSDADYPERLKQAEDAPCFLYAQGNTQLLKQLGIGIVGSRKADAYGLAQAGVFAAELAQAGFCIISGFAQGIDGAAHMAAHAALAPTVAVLGTGVEVNYPKPHQQLRQNLMQAQHGCLVSEFLLGTHASVHSFPRRNRTIAGLSVGVLVVQAGLKSGSLITARLANELGRNVFAIPHALDNPNGVGGHALIQQGAKLVFSTACILEEYAHLPELQFKKSQSADQKSLKPSLNTAINLSLNLGLDAVPAVPKKLGNQQSNHPSNQSSINQPINQSINHYTPEQYYIMQCLSQRQQHIDELLQTTDFSSDAIQTELFMLELSGAVQRLAGGFYGLP